MVVQTDGEAALVADATANTVYVTLPADATVHTVYVPEVPYHGNQPCPSGAFGT